MFICYFLSNGNLFGAKIGKNTNSIQVKTSFFPFSLKYIIKKYLNMKILLSCSMTFYCLISEYFHIEY
ncbi:hypothetical protein DWZ35_08535 [Bacteroides caccae]|nr:hypothetical protein DW946_22865 [Bacteroides caccae]RHM95843.1 hypothetical protein DWZ35_08535 [Bacteroides caccae]